MFEFAIALLLIVLVIFIPILSTIWLWNTLPRWLFWSLEGLDILGVVFWVILSIR